MPAQSKEVTRPALTPFGNAIAGALAAAVALIIVYPLDNAKTRLQVQSSHSHTAYASTIHAILQILQEEGLSGLYAGIFAGVLGVASTNFAYFYWYTTLHAFYYTHLAKRTLQASSSSISTLWELVLGAGSGALAQIFTIPVSVVVTRQQTAHPEERKNFAQTWWNIVEEDGWTGLWRGLCPSLVLVINPAITYGVYEKMYVWWLRRKRDGKALAGWEVFVLGAIAKAVATMVTYPYIMAKVRMQWKPSGRKKLANKDERGNNEEKGEVARYKGAVDVLRRVHQHEGVLGWYQGIEAQIGKAVLSQALMMVVKDRAVFWTWAIWRVLRKEEMKGAGHGGH